MRKLKVFSLVAVMLIFGMMALGSGSDSEKKEIVASEDVSSEKEDTDSKTDASSEAVDDASMEASDEKADEETGSSEVTIEEQVLFEENGLKVTATEYVSDSIWGDGIKMLLENDGTEDVGLGCNALIVNDYMITDLFSSTIAAGKKANETLYLSSSGLKAAGIENVGKIEVYFHTFDPDTYMTINDFDCITIQTSAYDEMDTIPNDAGQELYNENGVKIVGKYVDENSFWGTAVLLYIENNSGKNVIVQCDDMSINGFMVTPYFSSTVYDGKKAIDEITLMSSELEESGINSVEDIELKFKLIDDNFMNSVESDVITFSAK